MQIPESILNSIDPLHSEITIRKQDFMNFVGLNKADAIIDKYLLFGTPFIFRNDENKYYELQRDIEEYFEVERANVHIVGSSKLGFSISPQKMYRDWTEDSDIDVALIDYRLFVKYWKPFYYYDPKVSSRTEKEDAKYKQFLDYFKRGWLRPDLFPQKMGDEVFNYLNTLYGKYGYKVRVGIYADHFFFYTYNKENINRIKEELTNGIYR